MPQCNFFFIWQVSISFNFVFQLIFIYYNIIIIGKMWHFNFPFFFSSFGYISTQSDIFVSKFCWSKFCSRPISLSLEHCQVYFTLIFPTSIFLVVFPPAFSGKLWQSTSERWKDAGKAQELAQRCRIKICWGKIVAWKHFVLQMSTNQYDLTW